MEMTTLCYIEKDELLSDSCTVFPRKMMSIKTKWIGVGGHF